MTNGSRRGGGVSVTPRPLFTLVQWCLLKALHVNKVGLKMQLIIPEKLNSILISTALCHSCSYRRRLLCFADNLRKD
jgi:hypothetical protein